MWKMQKNVRNEENVENAKNVNMWKIKYLKQM
jgi:hypothetical protein